MVTKRSVAIKGIHERSVQMGILAHRRDLRIQRVRGRDGVESVSSGTDRVTKNTHKMGKPGRDRQDTALAGPNQGLTDRTLFRYHCDGRRMEAESRPEQPPRLVYDDDCGFCTWAAAYFVTRGQFEPVGFSSLTPDQRARLPGDFRQCAHLLTDDAVFSCGAAMIASIARLDTPLGYVGNAVMRVPGHEYLVEPVYRLIASNRHRFGRLRACETLDGGCSSD